MFTGGEPLVRKKDILRLAEEHHDCEFHCFTNGTLIDEEFCEAVQKLGNISFSLSLEGFEEVNDGRRGEGIFDKFWQHGSDEKTRSAFWYFHLLHKSKPRDRYK